MATFKIQILDQHTPFLRGMAAQFGGNRSKFMEGLRQAANRTARDAKAQFTNADTQRKSNLKKWMLGKKMTKVFSRKAAERRNRGALAELSFLNLTLKLHRLGWPLVQRPGIKVSGRTRPGRRGFALRRGMRLSHGEGIVRGNRIFQRRNPSKPVYHHRKKMLAGIFQSVARRASALFIKNAEVKLAYQLTLISQKAKTGAIRRTS